MDSQLILIIVLVVISAAFSGAEIAFTSLSTAKVRTFLNDNRFASKAIYQLKTHPESLLITILLCNNLTTILASVTATVWGIRAFGGTALGMVTGALTFVILVFGEITPKTIALKYAVVFSRIIAYPLLLLTYVLRPITWVLEKFIHGLMLIFKARNPIQSVSEEELLALVDMGTKEGIIEEHEQEFIENVLEFSDTTVEEVMTIEKNVDALEVNTTIKDTAKFFVEHSYSRVPVYKKTIDNIVGIITVHDILRLIYKPKPNQTLAQLRFDPAIIVPKTESISKLFREFQKRRQHLAVVVNEHGETVGLATLEDILEEIVGNIADEQDLEFKQVHQVKDNEWEAFGEATIEQIDEALQIEIDYPEHQTIGLLILEKLHRFPKQGEKIVFDDLIIQVKSMGKKKIEKVILSKVQSE